jgi:hypothetical protein
MTFPMMTSSQPPSPRVQELAQRIALAVAEFQQRNPDLSAKEVQEAAELATNQVDAPSSRARARVVAAALTGVAALGLGAYLRTGSSGSHPPLVAVAAVVVAVVAVIVVVKNRI